MSEAHAVLFPPDVYDDLPQLIFTEGEGGPLLKGSLAYCGFDFDGHRGEVFWPDMDGSRSDCAMDIIIHGDKDRESVVIGFDDDELDKIWCEHGYATPEAIRRLVIAAVKRT